MVMSNVLRISNRISSRRAYPIRGGVSAVGSGTFPLSIHASNRYLVDAQGQPFFSIIDTLWCAPQQLLPADMDTIIADCVTRKINGIIIELIEAAFSTNAPDTIDNIPPFTGADFSTPNESYFARVDYFINACKAAGIVVWMWPLYVGLTGGAEGWWTQYSGSSQAVRQGWGTYVGNRYKNFDNIILVHGGDWTVNNFTTLNDYINALIAVWPNAIHSYHGARGESAYISANGQSWLNLNNTYVFDTGAGTPALTEYGRSPTRAVFLTESYYESSGGGGSEIRNVLWQSLCSGCLAGIAYGHNDIWALPAGYASHLGDDGRASLQHIRTLINLFQWHKMVPTVDTSLVTTSLGSGTTKICPMLASDATFAWIYSPQANFTLNRAAFGGVYSNIRIRSYTTSNGQFSTISASSPASGTEAITVSGTDQVIVVDGA